MLFRSERFFREAESAGNLTHPNIIRIFDAGEDLDVSYIAMELLDGHDLADYCLKDNLLPMQTVTDMIIKCADALDYAHLQGVIHRDIKPANLLLSKAGEIKLVDFGIAVSDEDADEGLTREGMTLGTPSYMAPEQFQNTKNVDRRAVIYSLGVLAYEMLTAK